MSFLGAPKNLHEVWDGELIQASGMDEEQYFVHLRRLLDSLDPAALERGTVVDWAMEGHRVAALHAYGLPPTAMIDRRYVDAGLPVVDRALVAAGVRLAMVLNEALETYPKAPPRPAGSPYTDLEAAAHVGETATVVGTVVTVHRSRAGNVYLNFGADYPHQTFTGAVLRPRAPWARGLDSLVGRRVGVHGRIARYRGQAQIVIERSDQIVEGISAGD